MRWRRAALAVVLAWAATACRSEAIGEPALADTGPIAGFEASQLIGSLTEAQADELCQEVDAFYRESGAEQSRLAFGIRDCGVINAQDVHPTSDAQARQACERGAAICERMGKPGFAYDTCKRRARGCAATVGEYERCLDQSPDYEATLASWLPACDALSLQLLGNLGEWPEKPAACLEFEAKCPEP
jgi:hypothetical protein